MALALSVSGPEQCEKIAPATNYLSLNIAPSNIVFHTDHVAWSLTPHFFVDILRGR